MREDALAKDPVGASLATRGAWCIKWRYASPIIIVHIVALLACLPWLFSWTGVVLAAAGCYIFGGLGMNVGYHRLLTHRSFACPKWLERTVYKLRVQKARASAALGVSGVTGE